MSSLALDHWTVTTNSGTQALLRSVSDGRVLRTTELPARDDDGRISLLRSARAAPRAAAIVGTAGRLIFVDVATGDAAPSLSSPPSSARITMMQDDGACVLLTEDVAARTISLVSRTAHAPLSTTRLVAVAAHADGFLVADAIGERSVEVRHVRIDHGGVVSGPPLLTYDAGPPYPTLLAMVRGPGDQLITQVLPVERDGRPPCIAIVEPGRAVQKITRAWFGRDQCVVRDDTLFHFDAFGSRALRRLRLKEGAEPETVFDDDPNVVALSGDARIALCNTGESVVVPPSIVELLYEVRDVDSGATLTRFSVPAAELVSEWMVQGLPQP